MSTPGSTDPWIVFDYEVDMFRNLCQLLARRNPDCERSTLYVDNAITESAVLHARILVGILLSRGSEPDDIDIDLLAPTLSCPDIAQLKSAYGGRNDQNSPCWEFNKLLAHATTHRSDSFDYSASLNQLAPLIFSIVEQINAHRS